MAKLSSENEKLLYFMIWSSGRIENPAFREHILEIGKTYSTTEDQINFYEMFEDKKSCMRLHYCSSKDATKILIKENKTKSDLEEKERSELEKKNRKLDQKMRRL